MIEPVAAGASPTLLHATKANELIDAVNALMNMKVVPTSAGSFECSGKGQACLTIKGTSGGGSVDPAQIEAIVRAVLSTATVNIACDDPSSIVVTFEVPA